MVRIIVTINLNKPKNTDESFQNYLYSITYNR